MCLPLKCITLVLSTFTFKLHLLHQFSIYLLNAFFNSQGTSLKVIRNESKINILNQINCYCEEQICFLFQSIRLCVVKILSKKTFSEREHIFLKRLHSSPSIHASSVWKYSFPTEITCIASSEQNIECHNDLLSKHTLTFGENPGCSSFEVITIQY